MPVGGTTAYSGCTAEPSSRRSDGPATATKSSLCSFGESNRLPSSTVTPSAERSIPGSIWLTPVLLSVLRTLLPRTWLSSVLGSAGVGQVAVHAPVHREDLAGNVRGRGRGEEGDHRADLTGRSGLAQRCERRARP